MSHPLLESQTEKKEVSLPPSLYFKDVTAEEMETLYSNGYTMYANGQYEGALLFFNFLASLNPMVQKYWMGLGAAALMNKELDRALKAYTMAAILDPQDPHPHFHAGECYIAMGNIEEAFTALDLAAEHANSNDRFDGLLLERIEVLKTTWANGSINK